MRLLFKSDAPVYWISVLDNLYSPVWCELCNNQCMAERRIPGYKRFASGSNRLRPVAADERFGDDWYQGHRQGIPDAQPEEDTSRDESNDERLRKLARRRLVSAELEDFMRYLNSPWRIVWRNIIVGLARGLGAVFGATVIVALAIWVLKIFIDLPLIGQYAQQVRAKVDEVAQETRYSDDFRRLQRTMDSIDLRLQTQNELLQQYVEQQSGSSDLNTGD